MTSDTSLRYWRIVWGLSIHCGSFFKSSLIMHNAYAAILRPCPTHTQSWTLSILSVNKHLTPISVHSQASEDAVTFPKEIPFPRKQSWHWHRHWLASCQGFPTMAQRRITRSVDNMVRSFRILLATSCVKLLGSFGKLYSWKFSLLSYQKCRHSTDCSDKAFSKQWKLSEFCVPVFTDLSYVFCQHC